LFLKTPEANLVDGMKWLQNTVTRRHNVRHGQWGRLFGDRYKAVLVEGKELDYYATLWEYIHLNPVRAGLVNVGQGQSLMDYPWSSLAGGYVMNPRRRAEWLGVEEGFSMMGFADTVAGRRKMVEHLDQRGAEQGKKSGLVPVPQGKDGRLSHLRRGWYWGRQEFAERALALAASLIRKGKSRAYQRSRERLAHGAAEAGKILKEGFAHAGLEKKDLLRLRANDPRKVELARLVWKRTTVSQAWIAEKLEMRHAANVSLALHRMKPKLGKLPTRLREFIETQENAH
jgi:hypothetical protein